MGYVTTLGIITKYVNYGENDRIVSIFSAEYGRIDAKVRNCRKPTGKLMAAAQLFVFGEFQLFQNKDKWTMDQCSIHDSFYPLCEDYGKYETAASVLSIIREAVQAGEEYRELFALMTYVLTEMAYGNSDLKDLWIAFGCKFLSLFGYTPYLTECAACKRDIRQDRQVYFSPKEGGAVCRACVPFARQTDRIALEAYRRILLLDHRNVAKVRLKEDTRAELIRILENSLEMNAGIHAKYPL